MKLYLAGPMRGLPQYNYPAFHAAAKQLRGAGFEVFDPADLTFPWDEEGSRKAMGVELAWICAEADAVVLLNGWEKSLGAAAEIATAAALGLPVYPIGELVAQPSALEQSFRG
jgi:nucleoside 2-deoxyribosyltransferase